MWYIGNYFLSSHCLELGGEIHVSATSPLGGITPRTYWIGSWLACRVRGNLDVIYFSLLCEVSQPSIWHFIPLEVLFRASRRGWFYFINKFYTKHTNFPMCQCCEIIVFEVLNWQEKWQNKILMWNMGNHNFILGI